MDIGTEEETPMYQPTEAPVEEELPTRTPTEAPVEVPAGA